MCKEGERYAYGRKSTVDNISKKYEHHILTSTYMVSGLVLIVVWGLSFARIFASVVANVFLFTVRIIGACVWLCFFWMQS